MPTYQIYDLTSAGHLKDPPRVVSCQNDTDAIFAAGAPNAVDREIWQDDRRVAVVNADEVRRMAAMTSDMRSTVVMTPDIISKSRECLREADRSLRGR